MLSAVREPGTQRWGQRRWLRAAPGQPGPPPFPWQRPPGEAARAAWPESMEDEEPEGEEEKDEGEEKEEDEDDEKEEDEEKEDKVRGRPSAPPGCGWASAGVVLSPSFPGAGSLSPDGGNRQGGPLSPL